ncbi:hypothetical protein HPB50_024546 [Hyalomma asiaticum]|uniref:Uncharacterized protein n=1 Tax=Hyalomma asiaticum TaxID=266040 RepID=A0ACB7SL07_HYAAI|nr:hypothetical protein HPB50_024546 [Hyalomma asiaticum]
MWRCTQKGQLSGAQSCTERQLNLACAFRPGNCHDRNNERVQLPARIRDGNGLGVYSTARMDLNGTEALSLMDLGVGHQPSKVHRDLSNRMAATHDSLPLPPAPALVAHHKKQLPPPTLPPPPLHKHPKKKKAKATKSKVAAKRSSSETSAAPPSPPWPVVDHRPRPGPNPVVIFSVAFVVLVALAVASFFQVRERVESSPEARRARQAAAAAATKTTTEEEEPATTLRLTDNTEEETLRTVMFLPSTRTRTPPKKGG